MDKAKTYGITEKQSYRIGQTCDLVLGSLNPPTFSPQLMGMAEPEVAEITGRWTFCFDAEKYQSLGLEYPARGRRLCLPSYRRRFKVKAKVKAGRVNQMFETRDSTSKEIDLYSAYAIGNTGSFVYAIFNGVWMAMAAIPEIVWFASADSMENEADRSGEHQFYCGTPFERSERANDYDDQSSETCFVYPKYSNPETRKLGWRTVGFTIDKRIQNGEGDDVGLVVPDTPYYSDGSSILYPLQSFFEVTYFHGKGMYFRHCTTGSYYVPWSRSSSDNGKNYILYLCPSLPGVGTIYNVKYVWKVLQEGWFQ